MQSKNKTLKICPVIFCLLRSSYALGLPEFDGATFFMKQEIWKDINGYEGHYQISNRGRVKSLKRKIERIRKPVSNAQGYFKVGLRVNRTYKMFFVHRLIAIAFIPNPKNLPYINHIDFNPQNNSISNLEWCTPLYNTNHARLAGRFHPAKGEDHHNSKLTKEIVLQIRNAIGKGVDIAIQFNVTPLQVSRIKRRVTWRHI